MEQLQINLEPDELKFVALAVAQTLENVIEAMADKDTKWTQEARQDFADMLRAGSSVAAKLASVGLNASTLPPYEKGDKDKYINKN